MVKPQGIEIPGYVDSEESPLDSEKEDELSPAKMTNQSIDSKDDGVGGAPGVTLSAFNKLSKIVTDMRGNIRILKTKVGEIETGPSVA